MDNEIICINNVLVKNNEGLTTSEISKKIFEEFGLKISRTIVKNYLWSYFRELIEYNSSNYTYKFKNDQFLIKDIFVEVTKKSPRSISTKIEGEKIIIIADESTPLKDYIKAIGLFNFRSLKNKKNIDLIKQINRTIEQINE